MTPQLNKTLRHGGMSRRGFLRALGVTVSAVLVPGLAPRLMIPPPEQRMLLPFGSLGHIRFVTRWEHHFPAPILDPLIRRFIYPPVETRAYLVERKS